MKKSILVSFLIFFAISIQAEVLNIQIKIPDLPKEWRLPTKEELNHRMRPQSLMLYPDYIDIGIFDNDRKWEYVVLVVSKEQNIEAALVYLSAQQKWIVLDSSPTFETKKVGMRMKVLDSHPAAISYGKLGGNGYLYFWDKEQKKFKKVFD